MLERGPTPEEMTALVGERLYGVWRQLCACIDADYEMDHLWNTGGKAWTYEYKYRRGGRTLCALYARKDGIGFLVILGKEERLQFEREREKYGAETRRVYQESQTYRDGKWMMLEPTDTALFEDILRLLRLKRKPNKP